MKWNKTKCIEYLREFDAFIHKYFFKYTNNSERGDESKRIITENCELWNDILNAQFHSRANHNLSYRDEASAAAGIEQVYKDAERYTNEYIEMLNLVRDRFIYDYTGISGLCDFFSPAYFEYEWGMHLEIDYNKHDSRYYRDHYVHQIRNLYEMFTLLDDYGYYDKCWAVYTNPESRVGTYIFEAIEKELLSLTDTDRRYYRNILQINGYTDLGNCCETTEEYHSAMRKLMFHYVVYSATIIAALVHDIGYPISYIRRISSGISKNLPICQLLTSISNDYASIEQTLRASLLFNIAFPDRIKKRMDDTEEHGAQSAIVLLMYFYQHGEGLSILQHCAIEVAALMIYNHTNKYDLIDSSKKGTDLIRSDINKEPLSHIFRMCDDLQEWDRVYFEVTDQNNIKVCPICGTPITRLFTSDRMDPCDRKYFCCCRNAEEGIYDTSWFVSRRIINVIGCDELVVDSIIDKNDNNTSLGTRFVINYDCGALLNIMMFSSSFSKVRADCIKQLKVLHSYQGMADSVLFESFVSGNPFAVKIQILEMYGIQSIKTIFENDSIPKSFQMHTTKDSVYKEWRRNIAFYLTLRSIGGSFKEKCVSIFDRLSRARSIRGISNVIKKQFGTDYSSEICINKKEVIEYILNNLSVGYNNTNSSIEKTYQKLYEKMIELLTFIAEKYLKDSMVNQTQNEIDTKVYNFSTILDNETVYSLSVDYMLQQVHLYGFEKVKDHIEQISSSTNNTIKVARLMNLYRIFYERLYCMSNELRISVEKYISRSDYEDVKRCILSNQSVDDRIDFFIDYALFIELWNKAKNRSKYYFTTTNRRRGKNPSQTFDNVEDALSIIYLGDFDKDDTVLECTTKELDYEGKYEFRILKQHGIKWFDEGSFTLSIDEKNRTGQIEPNDSSELRTLLEPLKIHHGFEWKN